MHTPLNCCNKLRILDRFYGIHFDVFDLRCTKMLRNKMYATFDSDRDRSKFLMTNFELIERVCEWCACIFIYMVYKTFNVL